MKTCTKCKEDKPLDGFHKDSKTTDGVRSRCKLCLRKPPTKYIAVNGKRECNSCDIVKPYTTEFWVWSKRIDGSNYRFCRTCFNSKQRARSCPINRKTKHVKAQYGLTLEEYDIYLSKPCGICGKKSTDLDHNHATGEIRGGLCSVCNRGLGYFQDNIKNLEGAIKWLKEKGSYSI